MLAAKANDLSVCTIVNALGGSALPEQIYKRYLEPVVEYDKYCGGEYLDFINSYIKYNGHIKTISEKTYIHRNTVHYRIKKIEELADCDLSRLDTVMYLMIAVTFYNESRTGLTH